MTIHDTIAQIEALMSLTSSDPWEAEECDVYAKGHSVCECMSPGNSPYYGEPEARLIASMRNVIPSLIAYIRALEKQLEGMTSDIAVQAALNRYNAIPCAANEVTAGKMIRDMCAALAAAREAGK